MGRLPPKALEQGELDSLCGIYSVINGLNWALHTLQASVRSARSLSAQLSERECEELFALSIRTLPYRRDGGNPALNGVSARELARLLRGSRTWLRGKRDLDLRMTRPFYRFPRATTWRLRLVLSEHLSKPGTAAIIGTPWHHWTVVIGVTSKRFRLLDSSGEAHLPLQGCGRYFGRHEGLLRTGDVFLLQIGR